MKAARWMATEEALLLVLRDTLRLPWEEIESRMPGRTAESCKLRYYYYLRDRNRAAKRSHQPGRYGPAARRLAEPARALAPKPLPVVVAPRVRATPPVLARPPIIQTQLPATGRARRLMMPIAVDVLLRIESQGLTAGVFGDPPPGRSALDEKRRSQ